jgi:hypothetical protein
MNERSFIVNRICWCLCATLDYEVRWTTTGPLSRSRTQMPFYSVVRDDGRRLHPQCQIIN